MFNALSRTNAENPGWMVPVNEFSCNVRETRFTKLVKEAGIEPWEQVSDESMSID